MGEDKIRTHTVVRALIVGSRKTALKSPRWPNTCNIQIVTAYSSNAQSRQPIYMLTLRLLMLYTYI